MKQIVLITGGSRPEYIGFGLAQAMLEKGYQVILTARDKQQVQQLASQLSTKSQAVMGEAVGW